MLTSIFSIEKASARDDVEAVYNTMRKLERLATVDNAIACVLMIYLQPIASALYMYDVFNSIELWIDRSDSEAVTRELKAAIQAATDEGWRRQYQVMLDRKSR